MYTYTHMMTLIHKDNIYLDFIQEYSDYHGHQYRFLFVEIQFETGDKMSHVEVYSKMNNNEWKTDDNSYLPTQGSEDWNCENQSLQDYAMKWIDDILEGKKECKPITLYRNEWNEGLFHEIGKYEMTQ